MTTFQKAVLATAIAAAIGFAIHEARVASVLRAQVRVSQQRPEPLAEPTQDAVLARLKAQIQCLEAQTNELAAELAQANADKLRIETERDQAKRSGALYKQLVEQASSKNMSPTNAYPTPRHVWAAFGRMGRLAALSKKDDSKLSSEEKSALEVAKTQALEDLPNLVKAAKLYDAAKSSQTDLQWNDVVDEVSCLLYGALNLDEQQFNQVYGVLQNMAQEAQQKGLSKISPDSGAAEATKQIVEQFKTETQTLLTPEQVPIFLEVVTHFQIEPGKFGFNFNFSN
jgi:hypothetical protein